MKFPKVVLLSLLALGFLALAIFVYWMFIVGAVVCMIINQRELFRKKK
jgi:hypothetical protein